MIDDRPPRKIAEDPIVVQTLWLISQGIPFDIAWSLPLNHARAWAVVLAGFQNGKKFDWDTNEWHESD